MTSEAPPPQGMRLRDGWWVLVAASLLCLLLVSWAMAPALLRMADRPPGDGASVESYGFDLSNSVLGTSLIEPALLHRDMVPVIDAPSILDMEKIETLNSIRSTRYLVSKDLVIGVEVNGQARAYPMSVLHVHELIHDELGGVPILVSWHWPTAVARVLVRDSAETRYGISGLVGGGNTLLYERGNDPAGGEPLHSQLLARTITGPAAGTGISTQPHLMTTWANWKQLHPSTTAVAPDPDLKKRYKKSNPSTYYVNDTMLFPSLLPETGPPPKTWVTLVETDQGLQAWAWTDLQNRALDGVVEEEGLRFRIGRDPDTIEVRDADTGTLIDARHGLWFSINALEPGLKLH